MDWTNHIWIRYISWLADCLRGDFGISYVNPSRTVAGELMRCFRRLCSLRVYRLVMVLVMSIPIGVLCAVYKDGVFDRIMRAIVFMTTAMPAYWVGLLSDLAGFDQAGSASDERKREL